MHSAFMAVSILRFLFISTVAVRTAGGECILPHKICRTACLCHRVIQMTHCRREVVQSQLAHQRTDAALGKASLLAASVGVFDKIHVPGIRVAVCGFQCCRNCHGQRTNRHQRKIRRRSGPEWSACEWRTEFPVAKREQRGGRSC